MIRFDKGKFEIVQTGEGFLKAKITIACPGVFSYFDESGNISNEAKLPEDILSQLTIDSARGVPITDDHPKSGGDFILVDTGNYQEYSKGNVSEPRLENSEIVALATIYDAELIKKIKSKKQNEASIGFEFVQDFTDGYYDGKKYDSIQRNIIINHVALVSNGRAGNKIKIHIDKKEKFNMAKKWTVEGGDASNLLTYRRFDGSTDVQVDREIHGELMSIRKDQDDKDAEIEKLKKEIVDLKEQIEKLKGEGEGEGDKKVEADELLTKLEIANDKADEWKKKHETLESGIPEMIEKNSKEKFDLISFAKSVDSEMKVDGLSNKEIKLQIIAKGLPFKDGIRVSEQPDEIIEARYDAACDLLRNKAGESDKNDKPKISVDADSIAEKKASLLNRYDKAKEEKK